MHAPAFGEHAFDAVGTDEEIRKEATFLEGALGQTSQLAGDEGAAADA
jgi:hypothetical protein